MHVNSGKARAAPFRFFFACAAGAALCAQGALAQPAGKPGPMQSGVHAPSRVENKAQGFDASKLFATTCGWCHSGGGRKPGKGPQLMGTELTDGEIMSRIRNGKVGQMPAFGSAFNEEQLRAIVAYIRSLRPDELGSEKK